MNAAAGLLLFDLDGTLIDSAPDLSRALNHGLDAAERPQLDEQTTRNYIGKGASRLVHRAITGTPEDDAEKAVFNRVYSAFLDYYEAHVYVHSALYPAAIATLDGLAEQGWHLALVTNKPVRFTRPILHTAGLSRFFDLVIGGDTLAEKKPHPMPLLHAARHYNVSAAQTVMIGDSVTDIDAARNAGVQAVAVSYGYNGGVDLHTHGASYLIDELNQLPQVLSQITG